MAASKKKVAAKTEEKPSLLKILKQPEKPYRATSARGKYWQRFCAYDGKPVAELEKSCSDDPPSKPKKGTYAEKQEPFGGWMSFFRQQGLISTS